MELDEYLFALLLSNSTSEADIHEVVNALLLNNNVFLSSNPQHDLQQLHTLAVILGRHDLLHGLMWSRSNNIHKEIIYSILNDDVIIFSYLINNYFLHDIKDVVSYRLHIFGILLKHASKCRTRILNAITHNEQIQVAFGSGLQINVYDTPFQEMLQSLNQLAKCMAVSRISKAFMCHHKDLRT